MAERQLPWSKTCFVCGEDNSNGLGARFRVEGGRVVLRMKLDTCFEGYPGHVHGGVITALLDESSAWAASVTKHRFCFTKEIKVSFRRPVPAGQPIVVSAEVVEESEGLLKAHAKLEDDEGRILATSDGVFSPVRRSTHEQLVPRLRMPGRVAKLEDV